ncbi:ClpXP protease specificity-enhancing factor [Comamonas aquatica]|uniref:ClpXP protease specificity-enhancing factor n=1 Tax=Comamonas aquatica TaxID=225991 RepID=UPI00244A66BE|nr:ClpXP protease specificity-enhancing factor [Comamonas aquatica]MDH0200336.1 ClpXP protease specificity-enhancing factor [Comamonas aquatica]MDH0898755.1 ClpXP protease specificity-enhancing factor [Comamonas aquatica]MDH1445174.1 ClpXP protease specificity-enhancing factor [Comamonas aquatica]
MNEPTTTSTRPYLIRAIHEWCTDNGLTPYLSVRVDRSVQVPREFVNEGEIVLNVSYDATGSLQLGNEFIEFKARFGGKPRDIMVPVERVQAIYARESGQGMSFPVVDDVLADVPDEVLDVAGAVDVASPEAAAPDESVPAQVVQLVTSSAKPQAEEGDEPRPPTPATGRPALKRVK